MSVPRFVPRLLVRVPYLALYTIRPQVCHDRLLGGANGTAIGTGRSRLSVGVASSDVKHACREVHLLRAGGANVGRVGSEFGFGVHVGCNTCTYIPGSQ